MSDAVVDQLVEQVAVTRAELETAMADPDLVNDRSRFADVNRRWAALSEAFALADRYRDAQERATEAQEMLHDDDDPDIRALLTEAQEELQEIGPALREAMVEPDPNDSRDVIIEIRSAAGGDEAALFARDLLDVELKWRRPRWRRELLGRIARHQLEVIKREPSLRFAAMP